MSKAFILCFLVTFTTATAQAVVGYRTATMIPSGSCQSTWIGYPTLTQALAAMAAPSCDGVPAVLVDTQDTIIPYVVHSHIWVDFWSSPANYVFSEPTSLPSAVAALNDACSRLFSGRRCGIVGSTASPYAGGRWIVWNTSPW